MQTISQPANLQKLITNYLTNDFAENVCGRRCYQNFQTSSNDFFLSCVSQLRTYNQSYPLVFGTSNYQQFRNQACSKWTWFPILNMYFLSDFL
ncbi:hypothetical protein EON65_04905 [archaeon]|nr:MAG: hypothetical protein EON65_04905 [archaeon]